MQPGRDAPDVTACGFGVDKSQGARFYGTKLEPLLADIHERLAGVTIEQRGYVDVIRGYDCAGMVFYFDPPYRGCEKDYGQDVFGRGDFDQLAAQHAGIKGKFLLSINDTPGVRSTFVAFQMTEAETTYTVCTGARVKAAELTISHFDLN